MTPLVFKSYNEGYIENIAIQNIHVTYLRNTLSAVNGGKQDNFVTAQEIIGIQKKEAIVSNYTKQVDQSLSFLN